MLTLRKPQDIFQAKGVIENGSFSGRWHFSFGDYRDERFMGFGNLRVFNDDTLSAGAVWPLHPHHNIEVVTYCAAGEFRHADEHGKGGILKKGWVQHTTVGQGMWHSEINNRSDIPMRFIQMWFLPSQNNLQPSVEQKKVDKKNRTNKLLMLVSDKNPDSIKIFSDVEVFSCFLGADKTIEYELKTGRGIYLYVLEGGPLILNEITIPQLGAAEIIDERGLILTAEKDAEILLIDTALEN